MSDIGKLITERKARSPRAQAGFEDKYHRYAIGMLLATHRKNAGLSLTQPARRTKMEKTALSRLENHGEDVRLSTITRYVEATDRPLALKIAPALGRRRSPGKKLADEIELVSS